jgi:cytochrome P450
VPTSGARISGYFLPAGTEVGISQWAVGYNPDIYGEDVALFKPERWSEDLSHDPVAQKRRDQAEVWFSGGHMLCTGRNVALLEVYKIITQLFRMFDVEIVNTGQPWKVKAEVVVVHSEFFVKLTEREKINGEIRKSEST